jgi:cytoskeletal protein CcmA (bactofilin family)
VAFKISTKVYTRCKIIRLYIFRMHIKKSILLVFAVFAVPGMLLSAELTAGENATIPQGTVIQDDLYLAGGNVVASGTFTEDLVVAGGSILLNGPTSRDVHAVGGMVTVLGDVGDDLRVAGGTVTVSSAVGDDVVALAGELIISGRGIGGDAVLTGGVVRIDAPVRGDLTIWGGEVFINAPITGNVTVTADAVTLQSGARLSGDFSYASSREATYEEGAVVSGTVTYTSHTPSVPKEKLLAFFSFMLFVKFLSVLSGALLFGLLFRRYAGEVVRGVYTSPFAEMGRGLVALIVLPVVSVILLLTLIGAPLGGLGLIGFVSFLIAGCLFTPILMGALIYRHVFKVADHEVSWQSILLGTVGLFVVGLIPLVGWLLVLTLFLMSVGGMVRIKRMVAQEWR